MSVPTTLATSSSILAPLWQLTTWLFSSSIAPGGRLSSWSQLIVGTLNCMAGGSTLTSSGVSVANFAYGLPALASWLRSIGSASFSAAAQVAAPTFFCTAAS
jgi:hypothetical protein